MKKKTLISFVGRNDKGDLPNKGEGAILSVFEERKFDRTYLIWTNSEKQIIDFHEIAELVRQKLQTRKLCKDIQLFQFMDIDVVNHNQIYEKLLSFCSELPSGYEYTAAISSGTPAMQACWLLLAESGDFKINLIRTNEKIFGGQIVTPVKLGAALPRITRLKQEVRTKQKEIGKILPTISINLKDGIVTLGETVIYLSPVEFSHYCVLVQSAKHGKEAFRFVEEDIPQDMINDAHGFYDKAFPIKYETMTKDELEKRKMQRVKVRTWQSHISKINKAFRKSQYDPEILKYFQVTVEGKRFSSYYSIKSPAKNIRFIS